MGWAKKAPPPTSFSTSTNVGFGPQNFLNFSFNLFATLVQNIKIVPSASPKLLNLNQDHPFTKAVFLVKPLLNWGYDNFPYTNVRVTKLWSHGHIDNIIRVMWQNFVGDVINRIYGVINFVSKYLYFKKGWGSHFDWHHQNFNNVYYNNL